MQRKRKLLLGFLFCLFLNLPVYANNSIIKDDKLKSSAYSALSEALFNEKIHPNMKMDIFDILNEIANADPEKAKSKDLIEEFYNNIMRDPYKSTLTIEIFNKKHRKEEPVTPSQANTPLDKGIIEILRTCINSDNRHIVLYGLDSISKGNVKELIPDLLKCLNEKKYNEIELKTSLISTLGDIGDDSVIKPLKELISDKDLRIQLNTLQAIGDIDSEKANNILKENLKSQSLELSLLSAGILAEKGDPDAYKLLKEGLSSPYMTTKQKTIISMSHITNPGILPLLKIATNIDDDVIKAHSLNILSGINTPEAVELITPLLEHDKLMPRAIIALSKNNTDKAIKVFENILSSDEKNKKTYVIAALTRVNNKNILPLLKLALKDPNESIRVASAKLLYSYDDISGVEVLKESSNSKNEDISLSAAAFLGFIDNDYALNTLKDYLTDASLPSWKKLDISIIIERLGDKEIRTDLRSLLARQRPNSLPRDLFPSDETLLELLNDESKWTRLNACVFLAKKKNMACLPVLKELAKDPDLRIRVITMSLLGRLGSTEAIPILKNSLTDKAVRVRVKAAESILKLLKKDHTSTREVSMF